MQSEFSKHPRILTTVGIQNFRDYGGYRIAGGGQLLSGQLFRSGGHADATAEDLALVDGLGLVAIIDLRSARERNEQPCRRGPGFRAKVCFAEGYATGRAPHTAAAEAPTAESVRHSLEKAYRTIPFQPPIIAALRVYFETLASIDGPTLVHCAAGKDRTGIAVALLQAHLGVSMDDVLEDFLLTNSAGEIEVRMAALGPTIRGSFGEHISDDAVRTALSVEPEYLIGTFEAVDERFGSLDEYLADVIGVSSDQQMTLRERLTISA